MSAALALAGGSPPPPGPPDGEAMAEAFRRFARAMARHRAMNKVTLFVHDSTEKDELHR